MSDSLRQTCLMAAVIVGCAFSASQILHNVRVPVRFLPGTAARVNGRSIDTDSVGRTVAGMDARDRRSESAARHDVLSRMIDEELLVQHALDSGAAETSPEVRAALLRSAITRVNAEAAAEPIPDRELEAYFKEHSRLYATSPRFEVTPLYFESQTFPDLTAAQSRAEAARAQLRAGSISITQLIRTADRLPFASPSQLVNARTLASYFGPATAQALEQLAPGQTTAATPLGHGILFIYLNRKVPPQVPSLASVHDLVLADAMRERQEHALENLLTSLHKSARIEFANSPPATTTATASR
jgi:PPIC-type PPIASE domain